MSQRRVAEKRGAENHATRDDDGDDRAEDEFVTTPQIADASEMSTRRVVKVRRPEGSTATTSSSTGSGFFKDAAVAASSTAPPKPSFGFNFGANASSGTTATTPSTFSFGTTATTTSTPATFSFGAAPASSDASTTKPATGFSFGSLPASTNTTGSTPNAEAPGTATDEKKPLFGFPSAAPGGFAFATKSDGNSGNGTAAPTAATTATPFSFTAAPSDAVKKPATTFTFGFPATTTAPTAPTAASTSHTDVAPASEEKKPIFGAGSFNFNTAVNSFVAARTKMQEEAKDAKPDSAGEATAEAKDTNGEDEDTPDPAGFGSEIVEPTAREVLASAPSKLYLFEKGEEGKAGRWAERGTGDAKLVSQPKADNAEEHIYRLLVRGGYSLNATIKKNTFSLSKTEAKHLILLVATAEGPQTYLLKFTGPSAEANTTKVSEALKKVIEEVSKAE